MVSTIAVWSIVAGMDGMHASWLKLLTLGMVDIDRHAQGVVDASSSWSIVVVSILIVVWSIWAILALWPKAPLFYISIFLLTYNEFLASVIVLLPRNKMEWKIGRLGSGFLHWAGEWAGPGEQTHICHVPASDFFTISHSLIIQ